MKIKFLQKIIDIIRRKNGTTRLVKDIKQQNIMLAKQLEDTRYVFLPALNTHKETFAKYKNMYQGKEIAILGAGPTLKQYSRLSDVIHIGVNFVFTVENIDLDYLFIQDDLSKCGSKDKNMQQQANKYRGDFCKKFYGVHRECCCITEINAQKANAERYYFLDQDVPTSEHAIFSSDITSRPLNEWSSVIFAALEFALWTHPKRIYIIGCDCAQNGHIYWNDKKSFCAFEDRLKYGWFKMKEYIERHYPDIEVVSINPVGLKGLFNDFYTQSYANANPELNIKNEEILKIEESHATQYI